jgi:hypothetical protein
MDHTGHGAIEQLAALILVIGGGLFTALAYRARSRTAAVAPADGPPIRAAASPQLAAAAVRRSLVIILAGLSAGAAFIHLAAAPSHYAELGDLATGFLVSAGFQALWIRWCLAGPSRRAMAIGVVGNLAIVAAWAWTRIVGLPIGEFAGSAEPVGYPDGASVAFELLLVIGLAARWLDVDVAAARHGAVRAIASVAVVPVISLVLILTSLATVAIADGLDHGAAAGPQAAAHDATH